MKYYGPKHEKLFTVLSIGFPPFDTDSEKEAFDDATFKKEFSRRVTVIDIDDTVRLEFLNGTQVIRRR